jgi:tetratricopeptide (TPR) repeat protein
MPAMATGSRRLAAKRVYSNEEGIHLLGKTVDVRRKRVIASARMAREPTPHGARLRQRFAALIALMLFVLGFLAAVGLGQLVALVLLALLTPACGILVVALARRNYDLASRAARSVRILERTLRAARRVLASGALVARQRAENLWRKRSATKPAPASSPRRQASRLNARGTDLRRSGDPEGAIAAHTEALELVRKLGDRSGEAMTLNNLALALGHAGDDQGALDRFEEAAAILRELHDHHHEGQVVANLGFLHGRRGHREQALSCLETALLKLQPGSHAYRRVEEQLSRAS